MIVPAGYQGKRIAVFGLARTGLAAIEALKAAGATVLACDDNAERARTLPEYTDLQSAAWDGIDALVLAPGVPLTHPKPHWVVEKARAAGVPIVADFDLFEAARPTLVTHKLVAITGTNGKSTTTALMTHVAAACGAPAAMGGNIGTALMALKPLGDGGVYVVEASSYQLDLAQNFAADVAILLNITPDHLDRHGGMEGYVAAKKRLFMLQGPDGRAVVGVDDVPSARIAAELGNRAVQVSVMKPLDRGVYVEDGQLIDAMKGVPAAVGSLGDLPRLRGSHNWQNAAATYAAARILGFDRAAIWVALKSFPGLAHRQEQVAVIGGVAFVNDSKATNVDAAARALDAFPRIHWIAGGQAKEHSLAGLEAGLAHVRAAYLIGDAADLFARLLEGKVAEIHKDGTLDRAIAHAASKAASGDVVLLSPACASFDQFTSFEHRGDVFRTLVKSMQGAAA
ncbi:UDP-N-acetylmuramoyl-L-alanine--D-glutamate ligase [Pseudokordiimonas caeni]|uniref:UDP-N-acetylmuramoyl-L-alanine--D-glutamate ligase n=1 Tax=Pseudokordiimonas caeni TaxID=2997908 RepID=UPI00281169FD|nr:UDP-N-acetylmuramoyl-L-alanine--D-glutamate ligase [Pseudokordiimonas caeni]